MFTHNVTCSSNKNSLESLKLWLKEVEKIESEIRDHPIFEWGLYTTKENQFRALEVKEALQDLINVLTGEVIFGVLHTQKKEE